MSIYIKLPTHIDSICAIYGHTVPINTELQHYGMRWNADNRTWWKRYNHPDIAEKKYENVIKKVRKIATLKQIPIQFETVTSQLSSEIRSIKTPPSRFIDESSRNANNQYCAGREIDGKRIRTDRAYLFGDDSEEVDEEEFVTIRVYGKRIEFHATRFNFQNREIFRDNLKAKWNPRKNIWVTNVSKIKPKEAHRILREFGLTEENGNTDDSDGLYSPSEDDEEVM